MDLAKPYNIPLVARLDGPVIPGKVIGVNGVIPIDSERFDVNLQEGSALDPEADIALHLSVRFNEGAVVRNALVPDGWGNEERQGGLPVQPGQPFQILILCEPSAFKVAFNGVHFTEFYHRMPFERITHLSVCGSVDITSLNGVCAEPAIQTFNPPVPYEMMIPGRLYPGRQVRVRGTVPLNAVRFNVDFAYGIGATQDLALHLSFRPVEGYIALNTFRGQGWEKEERYDNVVPLGSSFDLLIVCEEEEYKIALNSQHFATFPYVMPVELVTTVRVGGDVQLSLVSIEGYNASTCPF